MDWTGLDFNLDEKAVNSVIYGYYSYVYLFYKDTKILVVLSSLPRSLFRVEEIIYGYAMLSVTG